MTSDSDDNWNLLLYKEAYYIKRLAPSLDNGLKASRELCLFSWVPFLLLFFTCILMLITTSSIKHPLSMYAAWVWSWYRIIPKYNNWYFLVFGRLYNTHSAATRIDLYRILKLSVGNGFYKYKSTYCFISFLGFSEVASLRIQPPVTVCSCIRRLKIAFTQSSISTLKRSLWSRKAPVFFYVQFLRPIMSLPSQGRFEFSPLKGLN